MKIIGYRRNDFKTKDGNFITGVSLYLLKAISPNSGEGFEPESVYLSDSKAEKMGFDVKQMLGKEVNVYFNKYGKVVDIVPIGT